MAEKTFSLHGNMKARLAFSSWTLEKDLLKNSVWTDQCLNPSGNVDLQHENEPEYSRKSTKDWLKSKEGLLE